MWVSCDFPALTNAVRVFVQMNKRYSSEIYVRIVEALCLPVLCGILIVGLWPFHVPKNDVDWLKNENGLHFGPDGIIVSSGVFQANAAKDGTSCSLEIWLVPDQIDQANTILAFDSSADPREPFSLAQDRSDLLIKRLVVDQQGNARKSVFKIAGVFQQVAPAVVTITAGEQGTAVYVDGVPAKASPRFGMSSKDLAGQLIVADSTTSDSWSGRVLGLATYRRQLTPAQVRQHYESWTKNRQPAADSDEAPAALYLFNERTGVVVHNQIDPATDLTIPAHYFVVHPAFLRAPWLEYRPRWSYWKDVSVNITGFIPLGFAFAVYFSSVRAIKRPGTTTIVLGLLTSLTIEVLQAVLPTRSSGMTDVITNTLGTAIGVLLYRWTFVQSVFAKASAYTVSLVENLLSRAKADESTEQAEKMQISA